MDKMGEKDYRENEELREGQRGREWRKGGRDGEAGNSALVVGQTPLPVAKQLQFWAYDSCGPVTVFSG